MLKGKFQHAGKIEVSLVAYQCYCSLLFYIQEVPLILRACILKLHSQALTSQYANPKNWVQEVHILYALITCKLC